MCEDDIILREGPEAYGVIYLPCASMSAHQLNFRWWDKAIGCTNNYNGCDIDEVLYGETGEDHDEYCNVQK